MFRSLTRSVPTRAVLRAVQQPQQPARVAVRAFASAPHGSAPSSASHHDSDAAADQPWKFGEDPTKKRVRQDWELPFYFGMGGCVLLWWVVAVHGPNTSIVSWAREEALHTGFKVPEVAPDLED